MKTKTVEKDHAREQAEAQLESIKEMVEALEASEKNDVIDADTREEAERTIKEYPLCVEIRSEWHAPGEEALDGQYNILLCTGGPACRIIGNLSEHGEPETARIEYQDWGTPWTEYRLTAEDEKTVLRYCQCFYFGE